MEGLIGLLALSVVMLFVVLIHSKSQHEEELGDLRLDNDKLRETISKKDRAGSAKDVDYKLVVAALNISLENSQNECRELRAKYEPWIPEVGSSVAHKSAGGLHMLVVGYTTINKSRAVECEWVKAGDMKRDTILLSLLRAV